MTEHDLATSTMRTVRFHEYGEPGDVLRLETTAVPAPGPGRLRVLVHACGLAPADWALCRGLFAGDLPRGIGIDVSGTVDAVGDGVTDVAAGDLVFGTADWRGAPVGRRLRPGSHGPLDARARGTGPHAGGRPAHGARDRLPSSRATGAVT